MTSAFQHPSCGGAFENRRALEGPPRPYASAHGNYAGAIKKMMVCISRISARKVGGPDARQGGRGLGPRLVGSEAWREGEGMQRW